jgi:hypothetical protein
MKSILVLKININKYFQILIVIFFGGWGGGKANILITTNAVQADFLNIQIYNRLMGKPAIITGVFVICKLLSMKYIILTNTKRNMKIIILVKI